MEQIAAAADSAKAVKTLADASSRIAKVLHSSTRVRYLIVSVERTSGLVYTPISNLSAPLLRTLNEGYATDLVGSIREQYLFPLSERGEVRKLCDYARNSEASFNERLIIVPIDEQGRPRKASVCDSSIGNDNLASNALDVYFESHPNLFTENEWRRPLNRLREQARQELQLEDVFFLLRPETRFKGSNTGRRASSLDLMQMGIAVAAGPAMAAEESRVCTEACLATSIGTLALLHDKERYYERASRQAATGELVKHGSAHEIRDQYRLLEELRLYGALNIPFPDKTRSDPDRTESKSLSWYIMPWIQLPKLSETVLRGGEFKKYELGALMRAAVSHLRQDYWHSAEEEHKPARVPDLLWAPLLIAQRALSDFTAEVRRTRGLLDGKLPVLHSRGVSVHDSADINQSRAALDAMLGQKKFRVSLYWNLVHWNWAVEKPESILDAVGQALRQLNTQQQARRLFAKHVHGDAHFLNLLVDSSVPEDPLVISIDPKSLEVNPETFSEDYSAQLNRGEETDDSWKRVFPELRAIKQDPTYDIAKYLMSTACFYGLALEGFSLGGTPRDQLRITNKPRVNRPLSDTGGISSASLIRLGAGIPDRSLWNHLTCADAVVREYMHQFSSIADLRQRLIDTNVGLVGLWLLTLRSLFSTARTLLPGNLIAGSILYLVTSAYMHDSSPVILKALKQEHLEQDGFQEKLQYALRWGRLAKKVEEKVKQEEG